MGPAGISTLVIDGETPGVSFGANERKMGWNAQPTRAVMFENARVPVANRLSEEGVGFKIAMAGLDGGRLNIAACSLGGAQTGARQGARLHEGAQGLRQAPRRIPGAAVPARRHGDRARGRAHASCGAQRRRSTARIRTPPCCARWPSASRTDVGFEVANHALQLHGGYGYLSEYGIEKIVRDLRVHQILEGTNEIMRLIVARKLIEGAR